MTPQPLNRPCGVDVCRYLLGVQQALAAIATFADLDGISIANQSASDEVAELLGDGVSVMGVISELIAANSRTVRAFESLGNASGVAATLKARNECESALVAQKAALAAVEGQP